MNLLGTNVQDHGSITDRHSPPKLVLWRDRAGRPGVEPEADDVDTRALNAEKARKLPSGRFGEGDDPVTATGDSWNQCSPESRGYRVSVAKIGEQQPDHVGQKDHVRRARGERRRHRRAQENIEAT